MICMIALFRRTVRIFKKVGIVSLKSVEVNVLLSRDYVVMQTLPMLLLIILQLCVCIILLVIRNLKNVSSKTSFRLIAKLLLMVAVFSVVITLNYPLPNRVLNPG